MKRKTTLMRSLERANGGTDVKDLLIEALNEKGTIEGAAEKLDIAPITARKWVHLFKIRSQFVASDAAGAAA